MTEQDSCVWTRLRTVPLLFALGLTGVTAGSVAAQSDRGRVFGIVVDAEGAVLPGVTCTLASEDRGTERVVVTKENGGIERAYDLAARAFVEGGVNRVILATDGDFNVGTTARDQLVRLIQREASRGIFLSVVGVGMGNLKDSTLEALADHGNGHYAYVDTPREARKVFVRELQTNLVAVAKDVKIQVELNPAHVAEYRLVGYENRALAAREFNDDRKDAGDMGAGDSVTVLYELVPAGVSGTGIDRLRYTSPPSPAPAHDAIDRGEEILFVKLRYKTPMGSDSRRLQAVLEDGRDTDRIEDAPADFQFAAAVAMYGLLLRSSPASGTGSWGRVLSLARRGLGEDRSGERKEFLELVELAREIQASELHYGREP